MLFARLIDKSLIPLPHQPFPHLTLARLVVQQQQQQHEPEKRRISGRKGLGQKKISLLIEHGLYIQCGSRNLKVRRQIFFPMESLSPYKSQLDTKYRVAFRLGLFA